MLACMKVIVASVNGKCMLKGANKNAHCRAHKNEWGSEAVNIVGSHPVGVGVLLLY
jgi:hypothetical protein